MVLTLCYKMLMMETIIEINEKGIKTNLSELEWGELTPYDYDDFKNGNLKESDKISFYDCKDAGDNIHKTIHIL